MTLFHRNNSAIWLQSLALSGDMCHVKKRPVKRYQRFNWPVTNGYEGAC